MSLTDRSRKFSNPFDLSQHIQQVLRDQAEQAGSRAVTWTLRDFDKVGGPETLRTIWADLKAEERVVGSREMHMTWRKNVVILTSRRDCV